MNLHIFGCACYPPLQLYNDHKLAFRSKKRFFFVKGYSNCQNSYRCLDLVTKHVYISTPCRPWGAIFPNYGINWVQLLSKLEFYSKLIFDISTYSYVKYFIVQYKFCNFAILYYILSIQAWSGWSFKLNAFIFGVSLSNSLKLICLIHSLMLQIWMLNTLTNLTNHIPLIKKLITLIIL